ncbi:Transient receptor potential cation channel subfamily A member 1 [Fasciola gigantica]|uniref:Transient receptor potential cation channel subfamily A member 1 n=1 Tax=Fasciola gigantica TaxID=46835 RepID=A0A504YPJ9_FASGI|nr:Transient receptor potential cation channel subfamily A member 1 [Fasciola gigantica]
MENEDHNAFTPLLLAVSKGHVEIVQLLADQNANLFAQEKNGKTAVYLCAEGNRLEMLRAILAKKQAAPMIDVPNIYGNTPLHAASKQGHLEIVKLLLENGADLLVKNEREGLAFHYAAKLGRLHIVRLFLRKSPGMVSELDEDGNSAIHLAASNGHQNVTDLLLKYGAAVDSRNSSRWTPLDCAAANGHKSCARFLLENGSPVDPRDVSNQARARPKESVKGRLQFSFSLDEDDSEVTEDDDMGPYTRDSQNWNKNHPLMLMGWQWQCGAVGIFLAWLNLLLFLRRIPTLGLFVLMFTVIIGTFIKFFAVFFLFIFAFAFGFYILLSNHAQFNSLGNSLMKTSVMTMGELDFDALFNTQFESNTYESLIFFDGITYALFVGFLIVMTLVIMNLLVGLAVDDIKGVQNQAVVKRVAMQEEAQSDDELHQIQRRMNLMDQKLADLQVSQNGVMNSLSHIITNLRHISCGRSPSSATELEAISVRRGSLLTVTNDHTSGLVRRA